MIYGRGYRTKNGRFCTIMGGHMIKDGKKLPCVPLILFSNPGLSYKSQRLGEAWKFDNAKLLQQNRFVLEQADNENMTCSWTFGYNQNIVDCLMGSSMGKPDRHLNCDIEDVDYPFFG